MNSDHFPLENTTGCKKKYWYGDLTDSGWYAFSSDPLELLEIFQRYGPVMAGLPSWKDAVDCGFSKNKDEYFTQLRNLCIAWSQSGIRQYYASEEVRLIKLVLILRETDQMISRIGEQIQLWQRMLGSDSDISECGPQCQDLNHKAVEVTNTDGVSLLSRDIISIQTSRKQIARDISVRCEALLPNCSALLGPLVSARLLEEAGSLKRLSRMPASRIQILGSRNAIFSHLVSGSPPPKHGLIFEHKRVHAISRRLRGKVARSLAAKVAIAVRIDFYRKTLDPVFLEKAQEQIERVSGRS